ncbi:MAG: DUF58 domain-containing protein [Candidatus Omnitrophica bacterium]|nr:DUF58 domain-containing protein [Candidatus Omnitrophota bacterium]
MAETTPAKPTLLEPEFLRKLEQLSLVSRKLVSGKIRGERRSKKKGISVDFADYRNYVRGDDIRFIDWNIFGRLDKLFLKLFEEEEDLSVYLLLDTSKSMASGDPAKFEYGKKLAAALGYLALTNYDRLAVTAFSAGRTEQLEPIRIKNRVWRLFDYLNSLSCDGPTNLPSSCRDFAIRYARRGIVVLISDFLDPTGYEEALKALLSRRHEVFAIHLMDPEEVEPKYGGHLKLIDSETGEEVEVTLNAKLREVYKKKVAAYVSSLQDYCSSRGIYYLSTRTDFEIERLVLDYLRRVGFVR